MTLLPLADNAYTCYTKAYNNENRILMLQEITSMLEDYRDSGQLEHITDKQKADYYETLGDLLKKSMRLIPLLKASWSVFNSEK